ncbi:MAG: hypothetical protein Q6L68_14260 [Thermostichus sp. DG02_5_bins_236]
MPFLGGRGSLLFGTDNGVDPPWLRHSIYPLTVGIRCFCYGLSGGVAASGLVGSLPS